MDRAVFVQSDLTIPVPCTAEEEYIRFTVVTLVSVINLCLG